MSVRALTPLQRAFITVGGLGRLRPASGTWGSLPPLIAAAALLALGVCPFCGGFLSWEWLIYFATLKAFILIFSAACIFLGDRAEAEFGEPDPSNVVADESAGMALTLMLIPTGALAGGVLQTAGVLATAFVLWRIMDILKPWPANALQRIPGGWGILLDDLAAAVYAGLAMILLASLIW